LSDTSSTREFVDPLNGNREKRIPDNSSLHGGAGALSNDGTLTVINSTFFGNRCAHSCTGGIFNYGVLTVTNGTFSNNMGATGGIVVFKDDMKAC